jgi:hypothetical protein
MTPTPDDFADLDAAGSRKRATVDALVGLVRARFLVASSEKAAVTAEIEQCRRIMNDEPVTGSHVDPEVPLVYPMTSPICGGMIALLQDALQVSDASETFTLKPSPVVQLPESAQNRIMDELRMMTQQMAELGVQPDYAGLAESAAHLEAAARAEQEDEAREQAQSLQMEIRDKLTEANFTDVLNQIIYDYVVFPLCVIKAPATTLRMVRRWEGDRLAFTQQLVRGVERIDPGRIFWSPAASTLQPGGSEYVIELRRVTMTELAELAISPDYDADEVSRAMALMPTGHVETFAGLPGYLNPGLNGQANAFSPITASGNYDVVVHWGRVNGALLEEFGVSVPEPRRTYEAEVCMVGSTIIRAALNPDPSGRRPYHAASFFPRTAAVSGVSPCMRLRDIQRAATSFFVALVADSALSGTHVELDPSVLHSDDRLDRTSVRPRQVRIVKNTGTGNRARAFDLFAVQSQAATFSAEIARLHEAAYEAVGMSRLAVGSTTGVGTIGRTAQGVSALLQQTTKPFKRALLGLESGIIEPVIQAFADFALTWAKPGQYAGDVEVRARGITGLVTQQGDIQALQGALQAISGIADKVNPETGKPIISPDAIPMLLQAIFEKQGISTEGIFDKNYTLSSILKGTTMDQSNSVIQSQFAPANMGRDAAMAAAATPPAPAQAPSAPTQAGPPQ